MALTEDAAGVFIIAATTFTDAGAIMGEAPKLSSAETVAVMTHMLGRVAGRVPVIVGVSNAGIANIAALSHQAMETGAAGVMIAPPRGIGTNEKHYSYFAQCFDALGPDVPVCHQDFPQITGVELSVDLFLRLVAEFPQLVMLKHEDWPGLNKLSAIRAAGGRRVSILCGNGGAFLPEEMVRGADGAMTGFSYPEMMVDVVRLANSGQHEAASELFDAYLPLIRLEQQPGLGLAVRKEILHRRGALASNAARAPAPKLSPADQSDITRLITRLEKRLGELSTG